jgi:hypothetical protein
VIGLISFAICIYGCYKDLSDAEIIFSLKVCQNTKGNMYGEFKSYDMVSANIAACSSAISSAQSDLYCSDDTGAECFEFVGTSDGDKVIKDFKELLTVAVVFDLYVSISTFIITLICSCGILGRNIFPPQVSPVVTELPKIGVLNRSRPSSSSYSPVRS